MKLLIIDDSSDKIGQIKNSLKNLDSYNEIAFEHVLDIKDARHLLRKNFYDLVILDLNMPEEIGELPSMKAGASFVDEIMETEGIKKPTDIVILTAFDESAKEFYGRVERAGFVVLSYDSLSTKWRDAINSKVEYLILCAKQRESIPRLPKCDVGLLTTTVVETEAIMNLSIGWEKFVVQGDPTVYHYASVNSGGKVIKLIHAQQAEMGMPAAAALTAKIILQFNPKCIFMAGIAAGIEKDCKLGDILVGTDVWNYSNGKYEDREQGKENPILSPDPKHFLLNSAVLARLKAEQYDELLLRIRKDFCGNPFSNDLLVHFGPIACGTAVVASNRIIQEQVKAHGRKTIGLDMESYGVCFAARETKTEEIPVIIVKSVSDAANAEKNDLAQPYAAYTSAKFVEYLITKVIVDFC